MSDSNKLTYRLVKPNETSLSDLRPAQERTILIEYRPFASTEKWVQYRFSAWSSWKCWFALACVVLFFALGGPQLIMTATQSLAPEWGTGESALTAGTVATSAGTAELPTFGPLLVEIFAGLAALIVGASSAFYLSKPTHLSLNSNGISLQWRRFGQILDYCMPWSRVGLIEVKWPKGKTSSQDCLIQFKANDSRCANLEVRFGAVNRTEDREKLMQAIQLWGESVQRSPELLEMLTPAQDQSYTELWLQALSAPPKRERLTPLPQKTQLHEQNYEVIDQLGVGGQGTAYLALESSTKTEVVLKEFILPVYVDVSVRRQALERMQNEAQMLRKLDNDRIVRLMDFFVEDHRGYLVLEKIDGGSLLEHVIKNGALAESEAISLALQMCEMLEYLHSQTPPVIHRDFTPDNLILNKTGILKLVDFNVAQQTESTATGTVVGKHAYISPEQFRGRPTIQSDIYSMGATLYYLLTAEVPEPITSSHPRKQRPGISEALDSIVAKATAFAPTKRYADIQEMRLDLLKAAPQLSISEAPK